MLEIRVRLRGRNGFRGTVIRVDDAGGEVSQDPLGPGQAVVAADGDARAQPVPAEIRWWRDRHRGD